MTEVNITSISRNFSDYINRVSYRSERFTILRGNKPVAQLLPVPSGKTLGDLLAFFAGPALLSSDEAAAFEGDLFAIRDEANQPLEGSEWAS